MNMQREPAVEQYHGFTVVDPYRWLEDISSEETAAWIETQNEATQAYFSALPFADEIRKTLQANWDYPRNSVPEKRGNRFFFFHNSGLQQQSVLFMQRDTDSEPELLLDPNTLSADGTVALKGTFFSPDGTLLAYGLSQKGSDWHQLRIRHVDERKDSPETLRWLRSSTIAWHPDNTGFYYNRYPDPATVAVEDQSHFNRVYWHTLGTPQTEDHLIFEQPEAKERHFAPHVTDDGSFLLLRVIIGTNPNNRWYYRPLASSEPFVHLLDEADANYRFIGNAGPHFFFLTTLHAPHGRVISIDIRSPDREHWGEVIAEQEDVIDGVSMVNQQLVVICLHHAHHIIKLYALNGTFVREIALPTLGSIVDFSGRADDAVCFFKLSSFLSPGTIYRYDVATATLALYRQSGSDFNPDPYITEQVFYPSTDGTRIPMFLTYRRDLVRDGHNPTLLHGYGGFRNSQTPLFSLPARFWIEQGASTPSRTCAAGVNMARNGTRQAYWRRSNRSLTILLRQPSG